MAEGLPGRTRNLGRVENNEIWRGLYHGRVLERES